MESVEGRPHKEGWVKKQGQGKVGGKWKTRYLVTLDDGLAYYKDSEKQHQVGVIDLNQAHEIFAEDKKKHYLMRIVTPERVWVLSCEQDTERNQWVTTIRQIMQIVKPSPKTPSQSRSNSVVTSPYEIPPSSGNPDVNLNAHRQTTRRPKRQAMNFSSQTFDIKDIEKQHGPQEPSEPVQNDQSSKDEDNIEDAFSIEKAIKDDRRPDVNYKVIIIGESGVGKTNLFHRWIDDNFQTHNPTINVEFASRMFDVHGKIIKVQIWDTAGQEQFRSVTRSYYRKSQGAILVYDVSRERSFERLSSWLQDIKDAPGNEKTQIMLIGNKSDLTHRREVTADQGIEFSRKHSLNFLETSALNGSNVNLAFKILLLDIYKVLEKVEKEKQDSLQVGSTVVIDNTTATTEEPGCCYNFQVPDVISSWFGTNDV